MTGEQLREVFGKIDDEFIEEAENYVPEHKSGKTIWIITSASAAVIALCTCIHYYNASDFLYRPEIDNTVVMTTTVSETKSDETDVIRTEKPVPVSDTVRENTKVTETESGYESSVPYSATVPAKTEVPSGNGGSSGEKTVITQKPQEVTKVPATEPEKVTAEVHTAGPVTDKPLETVKPEETLVTSEVQITATNPTPIPCAASPSPVAPTPTPCAVSQSPVVPSPIPCESPAPTVYLSPVNRENNSYDHAVLFEKTYSKRCVFVFSEDQIGGNNVVPFFIEDVSTGSGCSAVAKTVKEFSRDEIFLLKCGTTEGKYYVFLNDSLSDEEAEQIFITLGITKITTPVTPNLPEISQPVPASGT